MKLIKSSSRNSLEHNQKKDSFLTTVLDHVFLICQGDDNFNESSDFIEIESQISTLEEKIEKQNGLIKQSSELKEKIGHEISSLDDLNSKTQLELLESLGSE